MVVFVVDDNEDITDFLACLLSGQGIDVHTFNHPLAALACIKQSQLMPRWLISDYNLPSINGVELHKRIKSLTPNLQTLIISGRNAQPDVGHIPFMQKPFQPEQLINHIRSHQVASDCTRPITSAHI
ncbi:response regulator [Mariprofundus ferrooxydans]|nr:response regulator [Mariprofundus ferrooxydans]